MSLGLNCAVTRPRFLNLWFTCFIEYRFHTDPSGTFTKYAAMAIGSGSEAAQSELQDKFHRVGSVPPSMLLAHTYSYPLCCSLIQNMTLQEAHLLVLKVLKQVMEEKLDAHNVQLSQVSAQTVSTLNTSIISESTVPGNI